MVIVGGADAEKLRQEEIEGWESISLEEHMKKYTDSGMSEKDAMKQVAKDRGIGKRDVYQALLQTP